MYDDDDLSGHYLDYREMELAERAGRRVCQECHGAGGNCPESEHADLADEDKDESAPIPSSPKVKVEITASRFPGAFCIKIIGGVNA